MGYEDKALIWKLQESLIDESMILNDAELILKPHTNSMGKLTGIQQTLWYMMKVEKVFINNKGSKLNTLRDEMPKFYSKMLDNINEKQNGDNFFFAIAASK